MTDTPVSHITAKLGTPPPSRLLGALLLMAPFCFAMVVIFSYALAR